MIMYKRMHLNRNFKKLFQYETMEVFYLTVCMSLNLPVFCHLMQD